jgi:hypothetical protein
VWPLTTTHRRPSASELLNTPGALLTRSHLRELGLERRAVDAVFRELPNIVLPGYSRPMVRAEAYRALVEGSTYCDRCGDRVRGRVPGLDAGNRG